MKITVITILAIMFSFQSYSQDTEIVNMEEIIRQHTNDQIIREANGIVPGTRQSVPQDPNRDILARGGSTAARNFLKRLPQIARAARDLSSGMQTLGSAECAPDFSISAQALMPTGCYDQVECQDCYQGAINNLTTIRRSLARLSCIYSNTKSFNDAAISFGDNVSGIHAVTGLSWQYERAGIIEQFTKFENTYDRKYGELMTALQRNLQTIGSCENEHGMQDWYQKAGFIYYELMKEKYKR